MLPNDFPQAVPNERNRIGFVVVLGHLLATPDARMPILNVQQAHELRGEIRQRPLHRQGRIDRSSRDIAQRVQDRVYLLVPVPAFPWLWHL